VTVNGKGTVSLGGGMKCVGDPMMAVVCVFSVPRAMPVTLQAMPMGGDMLTSWSGACAGMQPSCMLTPTQATNVGADFAMGPIARASR
jgi:hypothetical protein